MGTERFDRAAADWDSKSRRVRLAGKISSAIAELPLSTEMSAMEYGCGTGLVGMAVAPLVGQLIAIDSSSGMLEVLEQKIAAEKIANMETLCCDLLADKYNRQHNLIFCSMTLHHIRDSGALLQRFAELLLPGGYLAIADLFTEDGSFHKANAEGIHHHGFDPEELKSSLEACGMEAISHRTVHSIVKEENSREYPVFLLTARKRS